MKLTSVLVLGTTLLAASDAQADEINCGGYVSWVMADYAGCNGHMAFKTEGSGGTEGVWMCTKSKEAGALVLAALLADKTVRVYIEGSDVGGVCTQLPSFRLINYVIIHP